MGSINKFAFALATICSFSCHAAHFFYEADYVVVGVGTAGAVVAKELSDDKETSVIALCSGQNLNKDPLISQAKFTPITVGSLLLGAPLPFDPSMFPQPLQQEIANLIALLPPPVAPLYETGQSTPQVNADNRQITWGIALPEGGATSINAGVMCRGTNQVFRQWEIIAGPEWSVGRILKIYKEMEDYNGKSTNCRFRGNCGPLKVLQTPATTVAKKFTNAMIKATGFPFVLDYNDPETPIGVSSQTQVTRHGKHGSLRVSSGTTYLNGDVMKSDGRGVHDRKLHVLFNSSALRIIWSGNTAVGVEFVQDGIFKKVYARKGVVVSSGLRSSAFLMYSGIGPRPLLESLNIPVIFDNPNVGQGLVDQAPIRTIFTTNPRDLLNPNNIFDQIAWLPAPGGDPEVRLVRFAVISVVPGLALLTVDLCQQQSSGSVSINSSNPLASPVIDLGLLTNPNDLALFQSTFTTYFKDIAEMIHAMDPAYELVYPTFDIINNPALLTAFIQENVGSNQHFQCHCRMAPIENGGVVDSFGRVYGAFNLFVADNSINPIGMDGSPMATGYLAGTNISRLIKKAHGTK